MPATKVKLIYVADPMCSWCWGFVPVLKQLLITFKSRPMGLQIMVGGLRPGGGDPWDHKMKQQLRHHWDQVQKVSSQPFNYELLNREFFNYDTEPACRLVVTARKWLGSDNLDWFEALQRTFYVRSADLAELSNVKELCGEFDMDFEEFSRHFLSEEVAAETQADFHKTRKWGIHGYPSLLLQNAGRLSWISYGYDSWENLKQRITPYLLQN